MGPTWCWALRRCFGAEVVISVHALANHGREGSLRDCCGRARPGAGALPPQIGCDRARDRIDAGAAGPGRSPAAPEDEKRAQDACGARGVRKIGCPGATYRNHLFSEIILENEI